MALYDPTAAAALVVPDAMVFRPAHMVMELRGEHTRGMTVVEWRVPRRASANVMVASVADGARLRDTVMQALAKAAVRQR
jgi:purine nucleosidase